jgi:chitin-binding protein
MKGRLPTGRTGRHLIYTVWQNTDTADTYYSCSDVVFPVAATPTVAAAVAPSANPSTPDPTTPAVAPSSDPVPSVAAVANSQPTVGGWLAVAAAVVVAAAIVGVVAMTRRRRRTSSPDLHAGTG